MSRPTHRWVVSVAQPLTELLAAHGAESALAAGSVFVDGKRVSDGTRELSVGARVDVYAPRETPHSIEILQQRGGLAFVLKPVGIATEPERRGSDNALVTLAAPLLGVSTDQVSALTRLDVGVSGVVLLAIDAAARRRVNELRERGAFERRYVALATATPAPASGVWNDPIGRARGSLRAVLPGGEPAETRYRVAGHAQSGHSVLALRPLSGRTHQLRVHASFHGAPLLGDSSYGAPKRVVLANGSVLAFERVYLHAAWLALGDTARVQAPLPLEFESTWSRLGGDATAWQAAVDEPVA